MKKHQILKYDKKEKDSKEPLKMLVRPELCTTVSKDLTWVGPSFFFTRSPAHYAPAALASNKHKHIPTFELGVEGMLCP